MNNGCKRRLIPFYFIGIILGFILAGTEKNIKQNMEQATFGAGCFWCVEAVFEQLDGVIDVRSGYTGGSTENPAYEDICTGNTGHAEVIQIDFDSTLISYDKLLNIFWKTASTHQKQPAPKVACSIFCFIFFSVSAKMNPKIIPIK